MDIYKKLRYSILAIVLSMGILSCDGEPLLTSMTSSNITVIFKGTYASNDPRPWWVEPGKEGAGADIGGKDLADDSVAYTVNDISSDKYTKADITKPDEPELPTYFMIDIAEMRYGGDKFALNRFYKKAAINSGSESDNESIFNGTGVKIKCNDLKNDKRYSKYEIFFRKFIIDKARSFKSKTFEGETEEETDTVWYNPSTIKEDFAQKQITGYNFIHRIKYIQDAYNLEKESNVIYPTVIKLPYNHSFSRDKKYVVEVRVMLKNYLKYYEYSDVNDDDYLSFFAPGDAIYDFQKDETYFGGNLIGGVHVYIPGETVTLSGTAPSGSYVVAIYEDDDIDHYTASAVSRLTDEELEEEDDFEQQTYLIPPMATWCTDGTFSLKNVPTGKSYKLYYSTNVFTATGAELVTSFNSEDGTPAAEVTVDKTQKGETIEVGVLQ